MFVKNKKSGKRAGFIQMYRRKLQNDLDAMGYPGAEETETSPHPAVDESLVIDAWGQVCQQTQDPSSMCRRVSLIR